MNRVVRIVGVDLADGTRRTNASRVRLLDRAQAKTKALAGACHPDLGSLTSSIDRLAATKRSKTPGARDPLISSVGARACRVRT